MKAPWSSYVADVILLVMMCYLLCCCRADWLQDLQSGETITVAEGVNFRVDKRIDGVVNKTSYLDSHVLCLHLWDIGMTVTKAKEKDTLQIGWFLSNTTKNAEARGEANVFGVFLPLLIGFKIAGSILVTLIAVLVVSLKAFIASKVALLLSATVAFKKMIHEPHAEVHYPVEYYPHPPPFEVYDFPSASGYSSPPHPELPSAPDDHDILAADSNLSERGHPSANASVASPIQTTVKRRIYKRKNSIVPILTLHRVTRQQAN